MAIFVEHQETHEVYILLGGGFGAYRSEDNNKFTRRVVEGNHKMVMVCNELGKIIFVYAKDLKVISIDGRVIGDFW